MLKITTLLDRLDTLFDELTGSRLTKPLPACFHEPADWEHAKESLYLPAAWRRQPRISKQGA